MYDPFENREAPPPPQPPKGWPWLAWVVILAVVAVIVGFRPRWREEAAQEPAPQQQAGSLLQDIQARYLVGAGTLLPDDAEKSKLYQQAQMLNTGPVEQRLQFVPVAGELAGPEEALGLLRQLKKDLQDQDKKATPEQAQQMELLTELYGDYQRGQWDAPSLKEEDRERLREGLGWFGRLALAPPKGPDPVARDAVLAPARRLTYIILGVGLGALLLGLGGCVLLLVFFILVLTGGVRSRVETGLPYGGVYAETFAVWLVLFVGLSLAGSLIPAPGQEMLIAAAGFFLSLLALGWPVLRGVPWSQVRRDIGWTGGVHPALEVLLGPLTYLLSLPFLGVGVVLMLVLLLVQGVLQQMFPGPGAAPDTFTAPGLPAHPIVGLAAGADWWGRVQIYLAASVAAPVVEETMFRGVLYRHLREASARVGFFLSFLFSAVLTSFLFAAVHPQGWVAIPVLMALAFGFTMAREWRGSLLPAMVAHGLSNGLVLTLLLSIAGN